MSERSGWLVVGLVADVTQEQVQVLRDKLQALIPDVTPVVIAGATAIVYVPAMVELTQDGIA
jgi:hypothetical protein